MEIDQGQENWYNNVKPTVYKVYQYRLARSEDLNQSNTE